MLDNEYGISGLQICLIIIASLAVPSVLACTLLSTSVPVTGRESITVCQAPQRAFMPLVTPDTATNKLDNADKSWTAGPFVNEFTDSFHRVEGDASVRLEIDDEFSTGTIAYSAVAEDKVFLQPNKYDRITFWIKSSIDLKDDTLQLRLINHDDNGMVVERISIPGSSLNGSSWQKVSVEMSGSHITDRPVDIVELHASRDPGAVTIWLDIIEAFSSSIVEESLESYLNELVYSQEKERIFAS